MEAYHSSALRTLPSPLLLFEKFVYTMFLDEFKILGHTHPKEVSISLVEMVGTFTWEITTLIAILDSTSQEQTTPLFEESTFLITLPAARAARHSDSLAFHIVFKSKIPTAYCTVHPARSKQFLIHRCWTVGSAMFIITICMSFLQYRQSDPGTPKRPYLISQCLFTQFE